MNKKRIIADSLLNSWEHMTKQEMIDLILSIGNYDEKKVTNAVTKWYSDVRMRMEMGMVLQEGWDFWINREIGQENR